MGRITIEENLCKGCGYCLESCPRKLLRLGERVNALGYPFVMIDDQEQCSGCACCAQMCPDTVIEVYR